MEDSGRVEVRWGVLSTANIARVAVVPALHRARNCRLVAVASRDDGRAKSFAESNNIPVWFAGYEALVEDATIDAVYIPLPNSMHHEWTVRAIQAGKHVLCEKPLAVSSEECENLASEAARAHVVAMEAFMYRFHPRMERISQLIAAGAIGDIRSLYSAFTFRLTKSNNIRWMPEFGGGSLMDVGCYCVNVSRTLMSGEPTIAQAVASWTERAIDAQMAGMLRFDDGATAQFDSALSMERREFLHVAGTSGHLEVEGVFLPGTGDVVVQEVHGRAGRQVHTVPGCDEYQLMVEHFADCVLTNGSVRYSLSEAAANMRVIEALYRSARQGGAPEPVADAPP